MKQSGDTFVVLSYVLCIVFMLLLFSRLLCRLVRRGFRNLEEVERKSDFGSCKLDFS